MNSADYPRSYLESFAHTLEGKRDRKEFLRAVRRAEVYKFQGSEIIPENALRRACREGGIEHLVDACRRAIQASGAMKAVPSGGVRRKATKQDW